MEQEYTLEEIIQHTEEVEERIRKSYIPKKRKIRKANRKTYVEVDTCVEDLVETLIKNGIECRLIPSESPELEGKKVDVVTVEPLDYFLESELNPDDVYRMFINYDSMMNLDEYEAVPDDENWNIDMLECGDHWLDETFPEYVRA